MREELIIEDTYAQARAEFCRRLREENRLMEQGREQRLRPLVVTSLDVLLTDDNKVVFPEEPGFEGRPIASAARAGA